ncbi:ADP-ribosylation factor family-domain-containing protein [Chaetomium sp. MPI-SDFR-AT-0129]|nr:ADP-ribosylation factor family-domain-containing protein [Chaetomium sp. MPI-SDFR-AT-0129]
MGIYNWLYGSACWFYDTLSYLGIYRFKKAKLVIVGLKNAGKSCLLQHLANHLPDVSITTPHPGLETLTIGHVIFTALDVRGQDQNDELQTKGICDASAIVFMVDAQDPTRFDEAAAELHALSATEGLEGVPFLVLGNKIDHPAAIMSAEVIWDRLRLHEIQDRPIRVFMCSVIKKVGYGDGIRWVSNKMF